jgi:hypothetical protein
VHSQIVAATPQRLPHQQSEQATVDQKVVANVTTAPKTKIPPCAFHGQVVAPGNPNVPQKNNDFREATLVDWFHTADIKRTQANISRIQFSNDSKVQRHYQSGEKDRANYPLTLH